MRKNGTHREPPPAGLPDGELWRRSRQADAPEDEAARYLDLAAFADGRLDPDEQERVAEWLARDRDAASDVAAAQALGRADRATEPVPEVVAARARALIGADADAAGNVVAFRPKPRIVSVLSGTARWGGLAAAMAVASWLGFTLGMDTTRAFGRAADDGFLNELFEPTAGLLIRDLGEDA